MPSEPRVGIVFLVNGQVLMESTPLSNVEISAGCQDHGGSHDQFWQELLAKRVVPLGSEYDQYPRGRIVYYVTTGRFVAMLDRCIIRRKETVTRMIDLLHLLADQVDISTDSHYVCPDCRRPRETKRANMLTTVSPPPEFMDLIVRREEAGPIRDTYEWQLSREMAEGVSERDPNRFPWGCYTKERQETYVGLFLWFESLHEMLTYLAEIELAIYLGDDDDNSEVKEMTQKLIDTRDRQLSPRKISLAKLKSELELVLGEYLSFAWIGTFTDLCEGKGSFAADVVGQFLSDDEEEGATPAIPPDRQSEFIEFLRDLQ
jgi:hypothetical protein